MGARGDRALGLPERLFGELVEPGTALGPLLAHHELGDPTVYAVARHDTASAFAAVPVDEHAAILSSGTWSLLGVELPEPVLSDAAREANLTNERGIEGTTRLLKNVMGLWLLEESRRAWDDAPMMSSTGSPRNRTGDVPLFDPDDAEFLAPRRHAGPHRRRMRAQRPKRARRRRRDRPQHPRLARLQVPLDARAPRGGQRARDRRIHVIGGGARNALLCRLTADLCGREVLAGPVEATALGNVLVQARGAGELGSLAELRAAAAASADPTVHEPSGAGGETYQRFLALTGLPIEERTP